MANHLKPGLGSGCCPACCCPYTGDVTLTVGGCTLLNGMTRTLAFQGAGSWLSSVEAVDGGFECNCGEEDVTGVQWALTCVGGIWTATAKDLFCITSLSFDFLSASCDPFDIEFSVTIETAGDGCCGTTTPTITLSFTE